MPHPLIGTIGVFTSLSRLRAAGIEQSASIADSSGYSALWVANARDDVSFYDQCLAGTSRLMVGSAVLSAWEHDAQRLADSVASTSSPDRVLVGLGVSHQSAQEPGLPTPLSRLDAFVGDLGHAGVGAHQVIIGANGPKMLALAGSRSLGAVTQLVTPERTARQRAWLGTDSVLCTEVKVVSEGDTADRRRLGRANLSNYLGLRTYRRNLQATGFDEEDLADGGSDHLIDSLVAGPDIESILSRITEHRDAGADHICLHILSDHDQAPVEQWETLATRLALVDI